MKRLALTLGLLLIMITVGCGESKPVPVVEQDSPKIIITNYDELMAGHTELQVKYQILEAQYNALKHNYEAIQEYLVADTTFKEQYESLSTQFEALSVRYSEVKDNLYAVNARGDPIINEYYPSDNKTAKVRWETFYEFWDNWWEEFEDNL